MVGPSKRVASNWDSIISEGDRQLPCNKVAKQHSLKEFQASVTAKASRVASLKARLQQIKQKRKVH